ncbi:MAG TPA: DUF4236 domain-containing protein [Rhizomicrobium sp.]|nr:DUF4236 domain-containing protein [Rhizomicrobium sp.]
MGWRFHRVLNVFPGLVRVNLSKSGASLSVGPHGADVNIGPHGATTNAGIPGTGLSYRQKLGVAHASGIGVGLFIAALLFAGWRYFGNDMRAPTVPTPPSATQTATAAPADTSADGEDDSGGIPTVTREPRGSHGRGGNDANAGADVIAAATPASGTMFVHRNNSDLRAKPATSSPAIKKLAKGEQVTLLAVSDKWSEVQDGTVKGWVRSSIIKSTPPGTKTPRKKKADESGDN